MTDSASQQSSGRLRRLCQILAILAVLWAIVAVVRAFWAPSSLELARSSVETGHFNEAIGYYFQYLENEPDDWGARMELGLVLNEVDRPQALAEFRKVPPESEARIDALKQIAAICVSTERLREAEEALRELVEKTPEDGDAQLMLAELYFREGNATAALPHAQKSAGLNPKLPRAHFLLAEVLDDLNRPAEMVEPLHDALELDPENYAANLNLSYAYSEAGEPARSRHHAEWCLAKNPKDVSARRFLALALRDQGETDKALAEIERALETDPNDLEARLVEAELLLFQRQAEEAFRRLEPFGKTYADDRRVAALLARAAAAAGLSQQAEEYRKQVQKLTN
jgi:tetratricopeptide (TPR) repeat protein